jgi:acid phosphatase
MEENHGYTNVIGNAAMPYLNSLAAQNSLATQYYANTHPSIGNYFMLTAGQIITNNDAFTGVVTADNLVRHLLTAGKTWKSYAEGLPSVGYLGGDTSTYSRHHNPFTYFSDVVNSSVQRLNLVPFSQFSADLNNRQLPSYSFVVPDRQDDAHDCPTGMSTCTDNQKLAAADAWLKSHIAPLLSNPVFQQDGLLVILFDESVITDTAHGGGRSLAVMVGPGVKKAFKSSAFYQHQNLLRTVLDALRVHTYPGVAASSADMADMFITSASLPGACNPSGVGVTICSPLAGSTQSSPVHFVAAAASSNPIRAMQIYVDNVSKFSVSGSRVDTSIAIPAGTHSVVVQAWDSSGAVWKKAESLTVK